MSNLNMFYRGSAEKRRFGVLCINNIKKIPRQKVMVTIPTSSKNYIDLFTRIIHFGLVVFVLFSISTGGLADDYKKLQGFGYLIHGWIGIGAMFFLTLRIVYGILGPAAIRFTQWVPYRKDSMRLVWEDLKGLSKLRLPDQRHHQGLASLVEAIGL